MADNAMEIAHRRIAKSSLYAYVLGMIRNKKLTFKTLLNFLFITDFLSFYINYPATPFRYSRFFRPCKQKIIFFFSLIIFLIYSQVMTIFFSKEMRRTFKGIIKSIKNMFDLLIFYLLIMLVWALIGFLIINNLDHEVEFEEVINYYISIFL